MRKTFILTTFLLVLTGAAMAQSSDIQAEALEPRVDAGSEFSEVVLTVNVSGVEDSSKVRYYVNGSLEAVMIGRGTVNLSLSLRSGSTYEWYAKASNGNTSDRTRKQTLRTGRGEDVALPTGLEREELHQRMKPQGILEQVTEAVTTLENAVFGGKEGVPGKAVDRPSNPRNSSQLNRTPAGTPETPARSEKSKKKPSVNTSEISEGTDRSMRNNVTEANLSRGQDRKKRGKPRKIPGNQINNDPDEMDSEDGSRNPVNKAVNRKDASESSHPESGNITEKNTENTTETRGANQKGAETPENTTESHTVNSTETKYYNSTETGSKNTTGSTPGNTTQQETPGNLTEDMNSTGKR
ncbi:MAG: hypothetical protein ABEK16_06350 [Candidatus Nanohalobium sp.]